VHGHDGGDGGKGKPGQRDENRDSQARPQTESAGSNERVLHEIPLLATVDRLRFVWARAASNLPGFYLNLPRDARTIAKIRDQRERADARHPTLLPFTTTRYLVLITHLTPRCVVSSLSILHGPPTRSG
jgi:hypothetical protein